MSLFSRLFRKAPSPLAEPAPPARDEKAPPKPTAADRALAAAAEEQALRTAVDAGDAQAVARLVVAGSSTRVRQAAAEAIEDPDLLRQLIREVRGGNDKNVYKVLTAKRDAQLQQARELEQLRVEIDEAAAALERHSRRAYDTLFAQRLAQYEERWNAVAAQADAELAGKVGQWLALAQETLAGHQRQLADQAAREQAAADAAAEAQRLREEQAQAAAAEQAQAAEEQPPAAQENVEQQAEPSPEQQAIRQAGELIRKARGALSGGSTSRAASLRREIEQKLAGAALPAHLAGQLQSLDQQLDALKDWKSFSVAPKRAELIAEMELLVGADLDPPALAERIRSIQDEWRTLGKGAGATEDADQQRFQDAAQRAYQPCKEYFAAQALIREENQRRRDALLARLTAFDTACDWEQADWRAVIKTLRETKEEWRACSPVERVAGKPQQDAFSALVTAMQARLDAEYARNLQQKQALIERAQLLLAGEDNRKAIDEIKNLQQKWQAVGPLPREADQRLWAEFRQHCDAVFQQREQAQAAFTAGLEQNKAQALALCEQLRQIAALEGPELLAQAGAIAGLRSAFEALGELPRAESRELRNQFDQALDRCKKSIARQHARDAEHSWTDLFEAANHVRAYRLAVARVAGTEQVDTLKAAAEAHIAAVPRWPKGGLDSLRKGLAAAPAADLAANEAALRMLCIRAEILSDLPTPAEDQALRRDYLLQRLAQSMGQGLKADEAQLDTLAMEWVSAGPVEDAVYEPLSQRFRRCRGRGPASG
jgi:hypothetical protein